ncbi:FAD-binding oxidoreductase [Melioribacter sp. OK-6-Me]|uniref:FAD-binding oxidoreductase n=1 Tax=unclassified Melioribacter TaxID=2627329 RepID=UPI003ED9A098
MIIKSNHDEIQNYLTDASNYSGKCEAVYIPESEEEIMEIVSRCNVEKKRITVAGNGTGLTGGRVPEGGIVLSTEKLNKILEINSNDKYAVVQPSVILSEFQQEVESRNLFYPPDPTERNCYIGGTVATNASGARTFKYGPTRSYVLGLKIVLPDGRKLRIERGQFIADGSHAIIPTEDGSIISFELPRYEMPATKNAAGYYCKEKMDLIDLFIGSEGTLGIITEIKLKLIDLPQNILSCIIFFNSQEDALDFVEEAVRLSRYTDDSIISARGLELFDKFTLKFLRNDYTNIPENAEAAVWFEQEIDGNEDELISEWMELISRHNGMEEDSWIANDRKEMDKFKDFRHAIALKVNDYMSQRGLKKVGTDVAVPFESFKRFYFDTIKLVSGAGLNYVVYGHAGDSHIHLNMLPDNAEQYKTAIETYRQICSNAVKLKGTVSAEHGIGKLKREYFKLMYNDDIIKKMALIKLAFDTNRILNIGNIFDEKYLT